MLEKVHRLFLEDRFNFCFAPVIMRDSKAMYHILRLASKQKMQTQEKLSVSKPTLNPCIKKATNLD